MSSIRYSTYVCSLIVFTPPSEWSRSCIFKKGFANSKWKIYYFQVGGDNLNQFYHSPRAALH